MLLIYIVVLVYKNNSTKNDLYIYKQNILFTVVAFYGSRYLQ